MFTQMMFCETASTHGIEMFNTISSFAYILLGLFVLNSGFKLKQKKRVYQGMGILVVLLGVCSAILHITQTQIGLILDFSSMFLLSIYILIEVFTSPLKKYNLYIYASAALLFGISVLTLQYIPLLCAFVFISIIGSYFIVRSNKELVSSKYLYLGLTSMIVAFVFWVVDFSLHCLEGYTFNGHSIWHVLTSIVIYCVYKLSFESERM